MTNKIVSIFSGIDIFALGFKKYFDLILSVEIERNAALTLEKNKEEFHPNLTVWNRDIYKISDEEILKFKGIEGLIGGPSCQPFSSARGKFDPNDKRINGIFEFIRWVKLLQPIFFVFENSEGLVQGTKKIIFQSFIDKLKDLDYDIHSKVLNSHDYGNVQTRKRIIVVGFKRELNIKFSFPNPVNENEKKHVRDIIKGEPGECLKYSKERAELVSYVPEGGNWKNLPSKELKIRAMGEKNFFNPAGGMTGSYKRLHRDGLCPTLVTDPCQRNTMACHPIENRPLSINEYKRAQGIPDNYHILGSLKEQYKFVGNAVPRELSYYISAEINKSLMNSLNSNMINNS